MGAGIWNFEIEQGAKFDRTLTWKVDGVLVNLTGYSARMQIRLTVDSAETLIDLDSDTKGGLILGGSAGTISIFISFVDTEGLDFERAVHDIEVTQPDEEVIRLLQGAVTLSKEVTK